MVDATDLILKLYAIDILKSCVKRPHKASKSFFTFVNHECWLIKFLFRIKGQGLIVLLVVMWVGNVLDFEPFLSSLYSVGIQQAV